MKYFIVNTTIRDGEYEYLSQSPYGTYTAKEAEAYAKKDAEEWTRDDYREYEIDNAKEITKEEFDVIRKYIY